MMHGWHIDVIPNMHLLNGMNFWVLSLEDLARRRAKSNMQILLESICTSELNHESR